MKGKIYDEVWAVDAGRIISYFRERGEDAEIVSLPERRVGPLSVPQTRVIISGDDAEAVHAKFLLHFVSAGG